MRKSTGIVIASGLLLTLAACSASGADACEPLIPRGGLAATVSAEGEFGTPGATTAFPTPLVSTTEISSAIIAAGDGAIVAPGSAVEGTVTLYDAATGTPLAGGDLVLDTVDSPRPFMDAAVCAPVGSRVVAVGPAPEILGEFAPSAGFDESVTAVLVIDVKGAYYGRATGSPVLPVNGLPTVSLAPNGQPGLSFTGAEPPAELVIETLIKGDGAVVQQGDTVVVKYTGVDWETRSVFDSSWDNGAPAIFSTDEVVPGFAKALIGQTVGSQVLAAVPPSEGYGDSPNSPVGPEGTMVFVVDILGIAAQ